ncbi:hypothetical protein BC832DRAFT_542631 [Gaertneriomyces semiglobifer]|nr:hypothetical protein BC832DRAFT_542631 [Gaertneriomyces semiglobifer]
MTDDQDEEFDSTLAELESLLNNIPQCAECLVKEETIQSGFKEVRYPATTALTPGLNVELRAQLKRALTASKALAALVGGCDHDQVGQLRSAIDPTVEDQRLTDVQGQRLSDVEGQRLTRGLRSEIDPILKNAPYYCNDNKNFHVKVIFSENPPLEITAEAESALLTCRGNTSLTRDNLLERHGLEGGKDAFRHKGSCRGFEILQGRYFLQTLGPEVLPSEKRQLSLCWTLHYYRHGGLRAHVGHPWNGTIESLLDIALLPPRRTLYLDDGWSECDASNLVSGCVWLLLNATADYRLNGLGSSRKGTVAHQNTVLTEIT